MQGKIERRRVVWTGVFICLAMLASGCQQTPREVSERMADYGDNEQMNSEDIRYCSLSELQAADIDKINVRLDNMVLPEKIDFSGIESVSSLELSFEKSFADRKDEVAAIFGVDSKSLVENFDKKTRSRSFASDTDHTYFSVSDEGFFSYFSGLDKQQLGETASHKRFLGQYDLDTEDVSGKSIDFGNGEKAELPELCQKTEKWLNDSIPLNGCKGHVVDAYVRELQTENGVRRMLSLGVELSYKGIRFNSYATGSGVEFAEHGMWIDYDGADSLCGFSNGTGTLKVDSEKPVERIVSFESAVKLVNEKVSGFNENKIKKILPMYVLRPEYETEKYLYPVPGQKVSARPVYAFLVKTEEDDSEFGINKSNVYNAVLVDMETGDVMMSFAKTG